MHDLCNEYTVNSLNLASKNIHAQVVKFAEINGTPKLMGLQL